MGERELRCPGNKLFALVVDGEGWGIIEVRCTSKFCGKEPGVIVLHRFNLGTGEIHTRKYREPRKTERSKSGSGNQRSSVRSA